MGRTEFLTLTDYERALVGMACVSTRAKWRALRSVRVCTLKKYLTPPTLSETRFIANVTALFFFLRLVFRFNSSDYRYSYPACLLEDRMHSRNLSAALLIAVISLTLSARVAAQGTWAVEKTFHIGGEGGMDYVTLDANNSRLYVPRSTHTMVIDADSGKTLADIPGQKHNHGVALVPEVGRGFISDGDGAGVIFDLKTNAVLGTLAAQPDADGIIFDKATGLVLVVSGDNGVLMTLKPDVDPKTGSIDAPIDLGGKPEFLASDGAGKVYINLEDKDQVAVVDIKARKVLAHWPVAPR